MIGPRSSLHDSWFLIGDILTGATLLEHPLVYPFGEITISGNGAIATVTDPSRALLWDSRQTLDVFDLNSMTHLKRFVQSLEGFECAGQVRFLPGDETVVSAPGIRGWGPIQLINLKTMSVEKTSYLPNVEADIGALAVGRRPQ
ncbi:MAG: hypothetical protein HZB43_02510 [candidate division Zixibacteria bacterium]|nr:hypothetical protein [candidate division Zixibacteria bacterium]